MKKNKKKNMCVFSVYIYIFFHIAVHQKLMQHCKSTMHACMLSLQSCPTLCDPVDCSPPGSSVHGILQDRVLEWVAMPSSRGSSWPRNGTWGSYASCIVKMGSLPLVPTGKPIDQLYLSKKYISERNFSNWLLNTAIRRIKLYILKMKVY